MTQGGTGAEPPLGTPLGKDWSGRFWAPHSSLCCQLLSGLRTGARVCSEPKALQGESAAWLGLSLGSPDLTLFFPCRSLWGSPNSAPGTGGRNWLQDSQLPQREGFLGARRTVQLQLPPPLPPGEATEGWTRFALGISRNTLLKASLHLILSGASPPLEKYSSGPATIRLTLSLSTG